MKRCVSGRGGGALVFCCGGSVEIYMGYLVVVVHRLAMCDMHDTGLHCIAPWFHAYHSDDMIPWVSWFCCDVSSDVSRGDVVSDTNRNLTAR